MDDLDRVLLELGWEYLSKWSRIRTNYYIDDITICVDQNAGYGFIIEFETVIKPTETASQAEQRLRDLMSKLNIQELDQHTLERMFAHYNAHRADYYGTERTFMIDNQLKVIRFGFDPHL